MKQKTCKPRLRVLTDSRGLPLVPLVAACRGEAGAGELVLVLAHAAGEGPEVVASDLLLADGCRQPFVFLGEDRQPAFLRRAVLAAVRALPKRHPGRHALLSTCTEKEAARAQDSGDGRLCPHQRGVGRQGDEGLRQDAPQ